MDLKTIIKYVKDSYDKSMVCSDDMVLDCATRIYNSQNFKETSGQKENIDNSDQPRASKKQCDYLYGLGYDGDASKLSITEAKHLIEEYKKKKEK